MAQDCAQRDDDAAQQRCLAGTRPEDLPAQPTDGVLVDLAQFGLITQCVADASQPRLGIPGARLGFEVRSQSVVECIIVAPLSVPGGAEDLGFQGCRFFPSQLGIVTLGTALDALPCNPPADRERTSRLAAGDGEWRLAASACDGISIKCASRPPSSIVMF